MSRIGRLPITVPAGVDVDDRRARTSSSRVPRAPSSATSRPQLRLVREDGMLRVERPDDAQALARAARPDPDAHRQHGHRRHHGLPQGPRDHRRRLPCPARGHEAPAQPGLQPPDRDRSARRHRLRGREPRPAWRSRASTRSWSATSPPASARRASPSPTRARASATRARSSAARPARPARSAARSDARGPARPGPTTRRVGRHRPPRTSRQESHDRPWPRPEPKRRPPQAPRAAPPAPGGDRGAAAAGGVPQPQPDLRPGHRRHHGPHARERLLARGRRCAGPAAPRSSAPRRWATLVAERARAAGIEQVVFDRAGFRYHGRIRSLADGARESGLDF